MRTPFLVDLSAPKSREAESRRTRTVTGIFMIHFELDDEIDEDIDEDDDDLDEDDDDEDDEDSEEETETWQVFRTGPGLLKTDFA
jgi:hypothetical protein